MSFSEDWTEVTGDSLSNAVEGEGEAGYGKVERSNLLNMLKIAIKALIESSMRLGSALKDDHTHLVQFLVLIELLLKHRLKTRRTLLGLKKSFWGVLEACERQSSGLAASVANIRAIPGIRTNLGRGRAWLRISLMQKKLSDHFRVFTERRDVLSEWYDPEAAMMCEEGVVVSGLLMGLNALDYNVLLKGEEFDQSVGVIDLSRYLKDGNYLGKPVGEDEEEDESHLASLMDQKAYLEELNRKLESSVERLQLKLEAVEATNDELTQQISTLHQSLGSASTERGDLLAMNEKSAAELKKALENLHDDQKAELDTFTQSRADMKEIFAATQKSLETEQKLRQQVEQELEIQKSIRQEKETALQLLEKSVHEKQDTVVTLRKQLEEIKTANVTMQTQLKTSKEMHQKDSLKIRGLESKLAQLTAQSKKTDKELADTAARLRESEKTSQELATRLEEVQVARSTAENDLAIEKQWRASLQMEIQREKNRVVELTNDTKQFKTLQKEHAQMMERFAALQDTVSDQEIAMVEMGRQLSLSQQKVSDMKEVTGVSHDSVWVDDKDITDCQDCKKQFTVARRKHHCRKCGGIFCYACSDNSVQLASSSKPVRVCNSCQALLLHRAST